MIEVGAALPDISVKLIDEDGARDVSLREIFASGRSVLFSLPGAFTPTCNTNHLPGFVDAAPELRAKGIEQIICLAVNDHHVVKAWAEASGALGPVRFIADGAANLANLLGIDKDMELGSRDELIKIDRVRERQILSGGPVDKGRGFVLHSADYNGPENTVRISNEIGLTATKDALRALSFGPEPRKALFALGYCGWDPGQLEDEILANGWLTAPHSEALLFDTPLEERYEGAMASLGISSAQLSHQAGTA
jgi:putative transcriptional regulator